MVPVLAEMTERVAHSMYHWDGPGALCHLDALLSLPRLDCLQWTPGAGAETCGHERWWPMYHRIFEAGKKIHLGVGAEELPALKREFGEASQGFLIGTWAPNASAAQELLKLMEV
jgi:5-methyltetrahydrofolate--homocysteine methyltransferase